MLHACFTPTVLCFVYTLWHFYAFSGTNPSTRCHSVSSYFLLFFYSRFLLKEIFSELDETRRNKSQSAYLSDMKTESKGETETSQEPATPGGGASQPLAAPPYGVGPLGALWHRPSAYKFTSSGKPLGPKHPSTKSTVSHCHHRP
jgi:hypothetical protein